VDEVGNDVVEEALVMGDHQHGALGRAERIDALRDNPESVDIEAGVGLVHHAEGRLQERHLHDFVSLFLAAREADVERPTEHLLRYVEPLRDLLDLYMKSGVDSSARPALALGVMRSSKRHRRRRDLDRMRKARTRRRLLLSGCLGRSSLKRSNHRTS
jgi:hypothetical protein